MFQLLTCAKSILFYFFDCAGEAYLLDAATIEAAITDSTQALVKFRHSELLYIFVRTFLNLPYRLREDYRSGVLCSRDYCVHTSAHRCFGYFYPTHFAAILLAPRLVHDAVSERVLVLLLLFALFPLVELGAYRDADTVCAFIVSAVGRPPALVSRHRVLSHLHWSAVQQLARAFHLRPGSFGPYRAPRS